MKKGQGSLEYLLILAAILAIAVVVVLIANMLLGAAQDADIANQDKYAFALNGIRIVGYNKPFDGTVSSVPDRIIRNHEKWAFGGLVSNPPSNGKQLGKITSSDGDSYPIYSSGGSGSTGYAIVVPTPPTCGNGNCDAFESCGNCEADCGICPVECGDGLCNGDEDCGVCVPDCGVCNNVYVVSLGVRDLFPTDCVVDVIANVTDGDGAPAEGVDVGFTSDLGILGDANVLTNSKGIAQTTFSYGAEGTVEINATAHGVASSVETNVGSKYLAELSTGFAYVKPFVSDADYLYWSVENTATAPLKKMNKDTLITGELISKGASCETYDCMDMDSGHIYWATGWAGDSTLWKTDKITGNTVELDSGMMSIGAIRVCGDYVYYMDSARSNTLSPKYIKKVLKTGGSPAILKEVDAKAAITMEATTNYVYWSEGITTGCGCLKRIPLNGGGTARLTPLSYGDIQSIVADDDPNGWVYFSVSRTSFYGSPQCKVMKVRKGTGGIGPYEDGICPEHMELDPTTQLPVYNTHYELAVDDNDIHYVKANMSTWPYKFSLYKQAKEC